MKLLIFLMLYSAFAQEKIALPDDFGTWNNPIFTKLGRCEIKCGGEGCKVFCK